MSFFHDMTTRKQRSSTVSSSLRMDRTHRNAPEALVDHVPERQRSQVRGIRQVVGIWLRRRTDRAILRSLNLRDIHDFCPRHTEAEAEMNKPFWRA